MVMDAYIPKVYVNDQEPPINAKNLNGSEQQLKLLTDALRNVQISLESGEFKQALDQIKDLVSSAAKSAEWGNITGKPVVIASGADQAAARASIGAGTSNIKVGTGAADALAGNTALLKIGTTATTAKAGNSFQTATQTSVNVISGVVGEDVQAVLESLATRVITLETTP